MKKKLMLAVAICSLLFPCVASNVEAVTVVKSYYFDRNHYSDQYKNYHGHQYVWIPNWSRPNGSYSYVVNSGWNYTRYQKIFYYTGGY